MTLTSAEAQRKSRARMSIARQIEAKYKGLDDAQPVTAKISGKLLEKLDAVSKYFDLSDRSRSSVLNAMLSAQLEKSDALIAACEQAQKNRSKSTQEVMKGIALEVFMRCGDRRDFVKAYDEFFKQVELVALGREDRSVSSSDIDLDQLEAIKSLKMTRGD